MELSEKLTQNLFQKLTSVQKKYNYLTKTLIEKKITITAMESCTSGLIASLITDTEGSSEIFKGSFVTYSNKAKIRQGVPTDVIEKYGSNPNANQMIEIIGNMSGVDLDTDSPFQLGDSMKLIMMRGARTVMLNYG